MLVETEYGSWITARQSWMCSGCVRIIPAMDRYWFERGTGRRFCVPCGQSRLMERETEARLAAADWPDHGFDGCCTFCDPATDDFDCATTDGGACCEACDFRGGGCLVECICGQPICTTRLAPGMTLRWDDRDVHAECYQVAVENGLMTPGGDDG